MTLPVARVAVDVSLAHLDRPFDYRVGAAEDATAVPGARVRVRFAGRLRDGFVLERVEDFASSYFVATRLLKPILAQAAHNDIDVADPNAEFNRWASLLPAAGDYGTQKLFVLRRR